MVLFFNLFFGSHVGFNTASFAGAQLVSYTEGYIIQWAQINLRSEANILKSSVYDFTWKFNVCFNFYEGRFARRMHLYLLCTQLCYFLMVNLKELIRNL